MVWTLSINEPGVNRPLRASEDHPQENLNKTYYRDQINKVANAIKEIITAIVQHEQRPEEVQKEVVKPELRPTKKEQNKNHCRINNWYCIDNAWFFRYSKTV